MWWFSAPPPKKRDSFPGSIVVTHFLSQFQGFCQESTTNNFMCKCCFLSEGHWVPISWKMLAIVVFVVARSLFGSFLRYPCSQQDFANDSTAPSLWIQELLQVQQWNWNIGLIFDLGQRLPGCQKKNMRVFFSSFPDDFFSSRQVWILETWKHGTGFPCRCPSANLS